MRAQAKNLEMACRIAPKLPDILVGDPGRLRQIVLNLVGNAIKFTERGEVVVTVSHVAGVDGVHMEFTVSDTGIGIPNAKLSAIFQPFEQADGSTTRRFGGTGLGLAISSRLVELMGGRITAESEPGRGSTFRFTARFDRMADDGTCRESPRMPYRDDLPILIVDDNATNRRILEEVLAAWGSRPISADGGPDALESLRSAAVRGEPFAVVLIDGMMPEMDGLDLARAIRSDPAIAGTALLLLTSAGLPEDTSACRALGFAPCLTKPVRQSELFEALIKALAPREREDVAWNHVDRGEARPESSAEGRLRVLLVEDHSVNQKVAA
jgi:two-component system, sensor histidine kinase and response regulator